MDRNFAYLGLLWPVGRSLSARRAWIEIVCACSGLSTAKRSLSARRAWIEMKGADIGHKMISVALRKESVDRNYAVQIIVVIMYGRSPQGERG